MRKLNKILLVDDDSTSNFLTQMILEDLQVTDHIIVKKNGQEALDYITETCLHNNESCPELIFLDINMPIMDGFEFLEAFQKLAPKTQQTTPIILLTSSTNPRDVEKAKAYPLAGYIQKPLTEEKLQELFA